MAHVVTCVLRHRGRVLLARRSDAVGTYAGRWAGISGYVEGDPADALTDARREIREETGLAASLVRAGDPLSLADGDRTWTVHPFLFEAAGTDVTPNEELADWEWVHAPAIRARETVPGLWETYRRVAPTVETVRGDRTHGSTWLSLRALEVLRDRAAVAPDWAAVADAARRLRDARPAMAAVANRVNLAMDAARETPESVREAASDRLDAAASADEEAAREAAGELSGGPVATLSRSETALAALREADVSAVVGESRPDREGVETAEVLAERARVTLVTDAALPGSLAGTAEGVPAATSALVGADAVLSDGAAVNKTGSYPLALAADAAGRPFRVVTARAKVRPDDDPVGEHGDPGALYRGDADVGVANPLFERVPAELVEVVTEAGALDTEAVAEVAARHREARAWDPEYDSAKSD